MTVLCMYMHCFHEKWDRTLTFVGLCWGRAAPLPLLACAGIGQTVMILLRSQTVLHCVCGHEHPKAARKSKNLFIKTFRSSYVQDTEG